MSWVIASRLNDFTIRITGGFKALGIAGCSFEFIFGVEINGSLISKKPINRNTSGTATSMIIMVIIVWHFSPAREQQLSQLIDIIKATHVKII